MSETSESRSRRSVVWLTSLTALFALASDLGTKAWALHALEPGRERPFIGHLMTLQLTRNPGAAFSLGAEYTWVLTLLSVAVVAGAIWYVPRVSSRFVSVMLGLLIGGAIGNLYDRLTRPPGFGRGEVVDFLNYYDFFVGNVADIWIVVAAAGLLLAAIFGAQESNEETRGSEVRK